MDVDMNLFIVWNDVFILKTCQTLAMLITGVLRWNMRGGMAKSEMAFRRRITFAYTETLQLQRSSFRPRPQVVFN